MQFENYACQKWSFRSLTEIENVHCVNYNDFKRNFDENWK